MDELTLTIPGLWADHHVLKIRDALVDLQGLEGVEASAKDRSLTLLIDPSRLDAARVSDHLTAAGYPPGESQAAEDTPRAKPEWATAGVRVTRTNQVDLTMSGDYRKY